MLASRCRIIVFRLLVLFVGTFRSKAFQVLPLKKKKKRGEGGEGRTKTLLKKNAQIHFNYSVSHTRRSAAALPLSAQPTFFTNTDDMCSSQIILSRCERERGIFLLLEGRRRGNVQEDAQKKRPFRASGFLSKSVTTTTPK